MHAKIVIKNETPKEKRHLSSEVAALSFRNHGNFFKKSRQLLEEITAIIEGNHGNN
jgi:hypothetical protein